MPYTPAAGKLYAPNVSAVPRGSNQEIVSLPAGVVELPTAVVVTPGIVSWNPSSLLTPNDQIPAEGIVTIPVASTTKSSVSPTRPGKSTSLAVKWPWPWLLK